MALSRSTVLLLLLPCPAVILLSASSEDLIASSQCLPSAEAVRQEYPGAWPSWTMHEPNHKGVRCWFPAMRENHARHLETSTHKNATAPEQSTTGTAERNANTAERRRTESVTDGKDSRDNKSSSDTPQLSASEMNTLGWSFRTRTTRIGFAMFDVDAIAESSFDDRFAAAFEVSSVTQPSVIQRMMDPVGAIP